MIQLRDYQRDAVDSINRFFANGYGNPLVVAPTGAGKSIMMAAYISECVEQWPGTRIMVLAHVKELLEQNAGALMKFCLGLDLGLFSAGLRRKDRHNAVIVAGVQSVYDKADEFGFIDLMIVDECHLINPKALGRYRDFIEGLKLTNPNLKVIGFTATPYRLGHGWIHKGDAAMFNGIAYDIPIELLIERGYLVRPIARPGKVHADLSGVHLRCGEFVEKEAAAAFDPITTEAVKDVIVRTRDRKCGLVFCTGLDHAEKVAEAFRSFGETSVEVVSGKTKARDRERMVRDVKKGRLRWLINVAVFTTGFDAPNIDVVVFLRATQSTALYVQMIGRGLRLHEGKETCLVLDYGENVQRHGPLNYLKIKEPGDRRSKDEVRAKVCPSCEEYIPINARECPLCRYEFPVEERKPTHGTEAAEIDLLEGNEPRWIEVLDMEIKEHAAIGKQPSMRVIYRVGNGPFDTVSEWVCFDHGGYPAAQATKWARERGAGWMPLADALDFEWPMPSRICVTRNSNSFVNVIAAEFENEFEEEVCGEGN